MRRIETFVPLQRVRSTFLNTLQDRTADLVQLSGLMLSRPTLAAPNENTLVIGAIRGLTLDGIHLPDRDEERRPLDGLSPDQWHYVYVRDGGPSLEIDILTDAPDASLVHRAGDLTRRYLGCLYATSATTVLPFQMASHRYVFRASGTRSRRLFELPVSNPPAIDPQWESLSFSSLVPPHARTVTLRLVMDSGGYAFRTRVPGDPGYDEVLPDIPFAGVLPHVELPVDPTQAIEYQFRFYQGTQPFRAWITGFSE